MPTPETATAEEYGISTIAPGITVESENISRSPQTEPIPDQKNAVRGEAKYDTRYELRLTYRGTKLEETAHPATQTMPAQNDTVAYGGHVWSVDSHEEAGSYNGLKRYNLTAHRFDNYPAQPSSTAPAQSSNAPAQSSN